MIFTAHSIRSTLLLAAILTIGQHVDAEVSKGSDAWSIAEANVARRNFFGLVEMSEHAGVAEALASDAQIVALQNKRDQALQKAISDCHDAPCIDGAFRWSDDDISNVATELQHLYTGSPAVRAFTEKVLRASGHLALDEQKPGAELLSTMWTNSAQAFNRIISVYGEAMAPRYAAIDRMRYDPKSPTYLELLHAVAAEIASGDDPHRPFFFAAMKFAVMLLATNDRLDAGRYEPLANTENAAAIRKVAKINWARYQYSVILVPGEGPEQSDTPLSPLGRVRVEQAARLFHAGKAPFILVSGGTVHPMLTQFDEAMEMRKELMMQWGVPADAILVDPYARHTTTNLRNAAREVIRYGLPLHRPMLIASDEAQIAVIAKPAFEKRCLDEMHLRPWVSLKRISPTEVEMLPNRDSLQEDPTDPMDP